MFGFEQNNANNSWKQKALERRKKIKELKKKNNELKASRDQWKTKADNLKKINKTISDELKKN
jgi:hypothetical protein